MCDRRLFIDSTSLISSLMDAGGEGRREFFSRPRALEHSQFTPKLFVICTFTFAHFFTFGDLPLLYTAAYNSLQDIEHSFTAIDLKHQVAAGVDNSGN